MTTQKTKKMSNMDPIKKTKKTGVNSGAQEGQVVPPSYKTPAVVLIYTVKSGKSLGSDRGKKTSTQKVKDPLSFEIWILRNGQPDCDDDGIIFVAMTST
jgi:hypothetical protein